MSASALRDRLRDAQQAGGRDREARLPAAQLAEAMRERSGAPPLHVSNQTGCALRVRMRGVSEAVALAPGERHAFELPADPQLVKGPGVDSLPVKRQVGSRPLAV